MRLYSGTLITEAMPLLKATPLVLPHVPEEPTLLDAAAVLERLVFGIHYYMVEKVDGNHLLQAVLGRDWLVDDAVSVTVYIQGKPYDVSRDWLMANAKFE